MSVLETPRIVFGGQISWDPIVTNNYATMYDEDSSWTLFKMQESVADFRKRAASAAWVNSGNWNPDGTHRSLFFDTYINSVDTGSGAQVDDAFVSQPVNFEGMLVDCEPYGTQSSQLFFDELSLGIQGGCRILAKRTHRITSRYINFFRLPRPVYNFAASVASVNWQTAFAKEDLQIDAHDSAALAALNSALADDDVLGITVRFNSYSTRYYGAEDDSEIPVRTDEFITSLAGGGFQPNPARSFITGVVGLWRKDEPIHEPGDRALIAQIGPNEAQQTGHYIASAHARMSQSALTIDLSNSISEIDLELNKQDMGDLVVNGVYPGTNEVFHIGTIPYEQYNKAAYELTSGIVTLPFNSSDYPIYQATHLQVQATPKGAKQKVFLDEQVLRAIPSDPNLYLNADDVVQTNVQVYRQGALADAGLVVSMVLSGSSVGASATAVTNADGLATFSINGVQGQVEGCALVLDHQNGVPLEINTQTNTYMYVRTWQDQQSDLKTMEPTWENVYQYCLKNWNAMAPCMDNWLDLKDPKQVLKYKVMLKKLIDPANFEDYRFMPVTRDMTAGERDLLTRFLDAGDDNTDACELNAAQEQSPKESNEDATMNDLQTLNRMMRSTKQ